MSDHKAGEHQYAYRGEKEAGFIVIGTPNPKGRGRWVTIAPIDGGLVQSFPEEIFEKFYWIVEPEETE